MNKFINDGDFVVIKTNKFAKDHGVKRGQLGYVAGHRAFPTNEADPYTQRIKFFVSLLDKDDHVIVKPMYLMDARSLKLLDNLDYAADLQAIFEEDFTPPNEPVEEPTQLELPLDATVN